MDLIADSLTRIRNATLRRKENVLLRQNKVVLAIVELLKREGFVKEVEEQDDGILVTLMYENGASVITGVERISRGGQRTYVGATELKPVMSGRGIGIISTSQGVMTIEDAKSKNVGGEYICKVW